MDIRLRYDPRLQIAFDNLIALQRLGFQVTDKEIEDVVVSHIRVEIDGPAIPQD